MISNSWQKQQLPQPPEPTKKLPLHEYQQNSQRKPTNENVCPFSANFHLCFVSPLRATLAAAKNPGDAHLWTVLASQGPGHVNHHDTHTITTKTTYRLARSRSLCRRCRPGRRRSLMAGRPGSWLWSVDGCGPRSSDSLTARRTLPSHPARA